MVRRGKLALGLYEPALARMLAQALRLRELEPGCTLALALMLTGLACESEMVRMLAQASARNAAKTAQVW